MDNNPANPLPPVNPVLPPLPPVKDLSNSLPDVSPLAEISPKPEVEETIAMPAPAPIDEVKPEVVSAPAIETVVEEKHEEKIGDDVSGQPISEVLPPTEEKPTLPPLPGIGSDPIAANSSLPAMGTENKEVEKQSFPMTDDLGKLPPLPPVPLNTNAGEKSKAMEGFNKINGIKPKRKMGMIGAVGVVALTLAVGTSAYFVSNRINTQLAVAPSVGKPSFASCKGNICTGSDGKTYVFTSATTYYESGSKNGLTSTNESKNTPQYTQALHDLGAGLTSGVVEGEGGGLSLAGSKSKDGSSGATNYTCSTVKMYRLVGSVWTAATATDLKQNDSVRFAVKPTGGTWRKAKFKISVGDSIVKDWFETTDKNTDGEFYLEYRMDSAGGYKVEAQLIP